MYNEDRRRFVYELYAPDCEIVIPSRGVRLVGTDAVWEVTKAAMGAAPDRKMLRVERVLSCGVDTMVCEAAYVNLGEEFVACSILELRGDQIRRDTTYR